MPLTNTQWLLVEPLLPSQPESPLGGRPTLHRRPILDAILYKLATGCPWYDLPIDSASYQTVYRLYRQWQRTGVLAAILRTLHHDLQSRGSLDLAVAFGSDQPGNAADHLARLIDRWRGTWQLNTALIFIGLAHRASRRRKGKLQHARHKISHARSDSWQG